MKCNRRDFAITKVSFGGRIHSSAEKTVIRRNHEVRIILHNTEYMIMNRNPYFSPLQLQHAAIKNSVAVINQPFLATTLPWPENICVDDASINHESP